MLLTTKLFAPAIARPVVERSRLYAMLDVGLQSRVTLITAPAGFGKTTLIGAWSAGFNMCDLTSRTSSSPISAADIPRFCWIALDESDNDLANFFRYVVAALQTVDGSLCADLQIMLQTSHLPPLELLLTMFINEVQSGSTGITPSIVLVLDDYHVITTQRIHDALSFLVENLPPALRLIITTRTDPPLSLARWRVRNQLTEVRADDLRFTADEAAVFLRDVMGVALTGADVAILEQRTEGWIAALQLAALPMQGRHDVPNFIAAFGGSTRYIVDYLLKEVWQRLPAHTQMFLMQTSLLDRFCAALCAAVTRQPDAQATLNALDRSNLFLTKLDDERCWYRYHHLFADVLRSHLQQVQPHAILQLHRRASEWYEQHRLLEEAMLHAWAIPDLELAASLVERHATTLVIQSEVMLARPGGYLRTFLDEGEAMRGLIED